MNLLGATAGPYWAYRPGRALVGRGDDGVICEEHGDRSHGSDEEVWVDGGGRRPEFHGARWPGHRVPRAQWRGEVDDDADDRGPRRPIGWAYQRERTPLSRPALPAARGGCPA